MMLKVLSLALALGLASPPALAQTAPDPNEERARELYQNGALLYDEGRYEDAIAAWQEAYRLSEKPELLFNIANAQERLGQYQEALDTLGRYRAYAPADEREMLDRRIVNLEHRLQEANQAAATQPPPTAVQLPGTVATTAPATTTTATTAKVTTPPSAKKKGFPVAPVALFTVGAAGIGTGIAFGVQAQSARTEAGSLCVQTSGGTLCPGDAGPALDKDNTDSLVADIGFGVGALSLAGGLLTSFLDVGTWQITPGFGRIAISGRF